MTRIFGIDYKGSPETKMGGFASKMGAVRYLCELSGTVELLSTVWDYADIGTPDTAPAKLAIYADENGVPGTLLVETQISTINSGWVHAPISLPVVGGNYYWLAFSVPTDGRRTWVQPGLLNQMALAPKLYAESFPTRFNATEYQALTASIYATYDGTIPEAPLKTQFYFATPSTPIVAGSTLYVGGQLQYVDATGTHGLVSKPIVLNIDGVTRTDLTTMSNSTDGGFYWAAWKTTDADVGIHQIAVEFLGDAEYAPCISAVKTVEVVSAESLLPPAPPVVQYPSTYDPRMNPNPICISNTGLPIAEVPIMKEMNIAWIRIDMSWTNIESIKGVYNWDAAGVEDLVNALYAVGINVLPSLNYGNALYTGEWNVPPTISTEAMTAWVNFVKAAVTHFKDRIKAWEVWNEPNASLFWKTPTAYYPPNIDRALEYMPLLKATHQAIKEVDPTAIVVAPAAWGLWCNPADANSFMEGLYKNGFKDYCDVVSVHPYTGAFLPIHQWSFYSPFDFPHMVDLVALMKKYGDGNKEIWITEEGAAIGGVSDSEVVDEQRQSDIIKYCWYMSQWTAQGYTNVTKYFVHSYVNQDGSVTGQAIKGKLAETTVKDMALTYNTAPMPPLAIPPPASPGPCFIATVAFGSPLAPQLDVFRSFRDRCLPSSIVHVYYRVGKYLAHWIESRRVIKRYTREALNLLAELLE